jgi:hypothetical protein
MDNWYRPEALLWNVPTFAKYDNRQRINRIIFANETNPVGWPGSQSVTDQAHINFCQIRLAMLC